MAVNIFFSLIIGITLIKITDDVTAKILFGIGLLLLLGNQLITFFRELFAESLDQVRGEGQ